MDLLNYNIGKEAFENNFGAFFSATKKDSGEKCLILKLNKTLKDEKFIAQVKDFVAGNTRKIDNVCFIKGICESEGEYYAEYEYMEGKPVSFVMSQKRKSDEVLGMIKSIAATLDAVNEAGLSFGGLTAETVITTSEGYKILGVEFFNTEYKLLGNEDLYASGYTDPEIKDGKYSGKSDVYSLAKFTATLFLAEKFYTKELLPIPDIPMLKPIQKSIDQATKSSERFTDCKAFADSLVSFKGTCPFTDHGSQIATYWYIGVVVLIILLDFCVDKFGWFGGALGG